LVLIHANLAQQSGSLVTADDYLERISSFLQSFDVFPERGTVRNEMRAGLRIVGFERNASVAFIVEDESVAILRIASKGQQHDFDEATN
jgi:toxin ParE1/3/4